MRNASSVGVVREKTGFRSGKGGERGGGVADSSCLAEAGWEVALT